MKSSSLILALCIGLSGLSALAPATASTDCADRFLAGSFGVPVDEPVVRAGQLSVPGFVPIYLERRKAEASDPAECRYVTAYDVFRLTPGHGGGLLAGCFGDFEGNGRRDYALLLREVGGTKVIPYVFLARAARYFAFALSSSITDPYGFNQDASLWPGPFCHRKPENGTYKALDSEIRVFGDVIQVGWYAYYWLPAEHRFQDVLIED